MGTPQPPGDPQQATQPLADHPLTTGKAGPSFVYLAVIAGSIFIVFLALDTVQFVLTGHESPLFATIAQGAGTLGLGGLIAAVAKTYIVRS